MKILERLPCDGCGQAVLADHIARRLERLEWTTRYRPLHIQTVLLGAIVPVNRAGFLYGLESEPEGEARTLLEAAGIHFAGKPADAVLAEFQRKGLLLTHVLECPLEAGTADVQKLIETRFPTVLTKIRRSLKPKRILLLAPGLQFAISALQSAGMGDLLDAKDSAPFDLSGRGREEEAARLRAVL